MFRDVINHMDLSVYAEIPLVIFLGVFVAVAVRVWRTPAARWDRCADIPLNEEND